MHRPRLIDPCPDFRWQIVVCRRHIGPHGVPARGRHRTQLQHRAHRRAFPERHIRVPYIFERRDPAGRLVEPHHVLRITRRQQRIGLQLAPIPGEFPLRRGAQPLPAEEQHLPLQQRPVQLRAQLRGQWPGQVQPTDFGPDGGGLRHDLEALVGPLVPAVGGPAQEAGPFVQPVGGDAVATQDGSGGRSGSGGSGARSGSGGVGESRQQILLEGKRGGRAGRGGARERRWGAGGPGPRMTGGRTSAQGAVRTYRNSRPGRAHPAAAAQKAQAAGRALAVGAAVARLRLTDVQVRAHATHRTRSDRCPQCVSRRSHCAPPPRRCTAGAPGTPPPAGRSRPPRPRTARAD